MIFLLIAIFALGAVWALATPPPINGVGAWREWGNFHPDEGSHVSVVRYMAHHPFSLPPYRTPYDTSIHPPLYHGLSAAIFGGAARFVSEENALRVVRLFGALLGAATVWFAYRAARQSRLTRSVAFAAAALVALIPTRVSLSGGITNENLAALGATATLAFLFECLRFGFRGRRFAWLVFWCVVAVGCKITCAGLVLAVGVGLWLARPRSGVSPLAGLASLLAALGAAWGWWFVYNTRTFGDPLRKIAADRIWDPVQPGFVVLSKQNGFSAGRYLLSIMGNGWLSFWGRFDGMTQRFPAAVYVVLLVLQIAAFVGIALDLRRILVKYRAERGIWLATGVFATWVLLIYIQYNWRHYTPQGRYFFVLLAPFGILMAGGMNALLRRLRVSKAVQNGVWWAVAAFLVVLNLYAVIVMPARLLP